MWFRWIMFDYYGLFNRRGSNFLKGMSRGGVVKHIPCSISFRVIIAAIFAASIPMSAGKNCNGCTSQVESHVRNDHAGDYKSMWCCKNDCGCVCAGFDNGAPMPPDAALNEGMIRPSGCTYMAGNY